MAFSFDSKINLKGKDWKLFKKFVKFEWGTQLNQEMGRATGRAARMVLVEIRGRIRNREYAVNALSTAQRKGFKTAEQATPLVDHGKLIKEALLTTQIRPFTWEVGILKDMGMSRSGEPMTRIIPLLHDGGTFSVTNQRGKKVTIRIPPRRFLSSVWDDPKIIARINKEWTNSFRKVLKRHGKL